MKNIKQLLYFIPLVSILSICACKKESDKITQGAIILEDPVTGQGFAGLKFSIEEIEWGSSAFSGLDIIGTEIIQEGVTNSGGVAKYHFNFKNHPSSSSKFYQYIISFDDNNIDAPDGDYQSNVVPSHEMTDGQSFDYRFMYRPMSRILRHIKNVNCFDSNDKMRFTAHQVYGSSNQNPFIPSSNPTNAVPLGFSYDGCYENLPQSSMLLPTDTYVYEIKVTRNDIDSIYYDTFINRPDVTDTFKIFY
jgi:hypothetical protein